jgi:hypothetical protein
MNYAANERANNRTAEPSPLPYSMSNLLPAPRTRSLLASLLVTCGALGATLDARAGDRLEFKPAADSKAHKHFRAGHELRIDDNGVVQGDLPYVSDGTAGWISSTHRVEFLDHYLKVSDGKPLEFTRQIRDSVINAKANITRPNGMVLTEQAPCASPLRRQKVRFTWAERLNDWARCYVDIDGEEPWLDQLRGEFEFVEFLPKGEVEVGAQWNVPAEALRGALAPGGNLKITPGTPNLFGRLVELGVAGDFADALGADLSGDVRATYRGRRQETEGEGEAAKNFNVGVIEFEFNLASSVDRTMLYIMAMPEQERREPARIESVPVEFTVIGTATLLWDMDAGRAHSFKLEGQESFLSTVHKTRFDGRGSMPMSQIGRYSGPLTVEVTVRDGADVSEAIEPPKRGARSGQKR